ncbi:hypothetical protein KC332_g510 [Hortaea werneckii]|uniref:Uncharacterized protein n=2 Tax=Hortaea werneckii TaxID=91943 RepID=A0A3M7HV39_HORWE|nr:hypothetical protein KC350_g3366 [Hortaea werneckii]OTA33969.1 hypothetical protein BTJ68_05480 [Hortaea werneckii EXF-2000]KAI6849920.1 hypothetical protein KC358_g955 [Hortaea werneckii]KAI6943658.1 hypothetical protein KC348_g4178 [Hortaea werneckii]KAI6944384.1 hypothetical protein KC341_g857 [Hortaea werneckii]
MNAGAGFHNSSKDEGSSPSLDTSQLNAENADTKPPVRPSRYSETTGTSDDDARCSDDERVLLYTNPVVRANTTHPNEHYVYEVDKFRALSFLVDRALEELPSFIGELVEVVEIPKQRHSRRRVVPYTELSDLPPSRDNMRWQNVIMQPWPSSTSKNTEQVFKKAIDSFEFDAAVTARQIIQPLSQTFDKLALAGQHFLLNRDPFIHDWLTIHSKAKQWANEGILHRKTRVCHTYQGMALTALLELNEDLRQFHAHTRKAYGDVQKALSIATAVDGEWDTRPKQEKDETIANLRHMAKNSQLGPSHVRYEGIWMKIGALHLHDWMQTMSRSLSETALMHKELREQLTKYLPVMASPIERQKRDEDLVNRDVLQATNVEIAAVLGGEPDRHLEDSSDEQERPRKCPKLTTSLHDKNKAMRREDSHKLKVSFDSGSEGESDLSLALSLHGRVLTLRF